MGKSLSVLLLVMFACALMIGPLAGPRVAAQDLDIDEIKIIIHVDNEADPADYQISDIKKIFLKETQYWDTEETKEIVPWALKSNTDEYKLFKDKVLEMDDEDIVAHWSNVIATGGTETIKKRASKDIFKQVSKDENAIGYIDGEYYESLSKEDKELIRVLRTISN